MLNTPALDLPNQLRHLRILYLNGEVVTTALRNRCRDLLPHVTLLNDYSIAETHDVCHMDLADLDPVHSPKYAPIGGPMSNVNLYILDDNQQPVPRGFRGELYIGGESVGLGYLNQPEQTAERFLRDPFANPRSLMFRSGDAGRILPTGQVEIQGRIAFMVKLRGYSIVPGAVETQIIEHAAVNTAVVVTQDHDETGQPEHLVAYVVGNGQVDDERLPEVLRDYLKQHLPHYAIPSYIVPLNELPIAANGKLDRKRLPKPTPAMLQTRNETRVAPPETQTERALAAVWQSVLSVGPVETTDNFFDLGGHSLLAAQMVSQIREVFQIDLPIRDIFEHPTLTALAQRLEIVAHEKDTPAPDAMPLRPVSRDRALPLSFAQEGLWFLHQLGLDRLAYNVSQVIQLSNEIDPTWLSPVFTEMVRRHEMLRTNIAMADGHPTQVIQPPYEVVIETFDFRNRTDSTAEDAIRQHARQPFDLAADPMLRLQLLQVDDASHHLQITMPHLAFDGWSMDILLSEFRSLYDAFSTGQPSPLPELPVQYADYAAWERADQRHEVLEPHAAYWKQQLAGPLPVLELPTDRPRPPVQTSNGAHQALALPAHLLGALHALGQRQGATLFMTLLAAFDVLLYRYTHQEDMIVGSTISNRNRAELEDVIGFFTNTLALRSDVSGDPSFRQLLDRVKHTCLEAYTHQALPFERLVDLIQPERDLSSTPIFQVMFLLLNFDFATGEQPPHYLSVYDVDNQTSKFDLLLCLYEGKAGLTGYWEYNTDLFDAATISRMTGHWQTLLENIVSHPEQPIASLTMITQAERAQVVEAWNATKAEYLKAVCLHHLFEQQVVRTPNTIAVTMPGEPQGDEQFLTYRQLNERANQLAHDLMVMGVDADRVVGLCCERSLDMVIGVLATLKAGGAYLPLDPYYPKERLAFMLRDAQAVAVLTHSHLQKRLPAAECPVIHLDSYPFSSQGHGHNPIHPVSAHNLAYLIYTSGSTGQPKGVQMPHRALSNLMQWQLAQPGWEQGANTLQFASLSFDVSAQEMFSTWASGGTLILIDEDLRRDFPRLLRFCEQQQVTHLFLPFVALQHLADTAQSLSLVPSHLKEVISAGEQVKITPAIAHLFDQLKQCRLHNQYGPSESHVVTAYTLQGPPETWPALPPIGRPIANNQIFILDEQLQPMPVGLVGELYIGGIGLAHGYLRQPELTAQRFIQNPFGPGKLYKTGDLARWQPDGQIEFLGRADHQVKVRGYRIELGEIEAVLNGHATVQQSVATVHGDTSGDKRLVAYVIAEQDTASTNQQLRDVLQAQLPAYMVPEFFVQLDTLPLTASGKVDRMALPAPERMIEAAPTNFVAPRTPTEEKLADIWADVLKMTPVGIDQDFFALGGHSLLGVQLMARIATQFEVELPLRSLFEGSTVATMAEHIHNLSAASMQPWSPLVPIQPTGHKTPFFCVHPGGGSVLRFAELARHLPNDQPFYALQAAGLEAGQEPCDRVEDMATHYLAALRAVQPHGPYRLGGWSLGGVVAFEMAEQLRQEGEKVESLALIDSFPPVAESRQLDEADLLAEFANSYGLTVSPHQLRLLEPEAQIEMIFELAKITDAAAQEQTRRHLRVFKAHLEAESHYTPRPATQRLTLLRASDNRHDEGRDPASEWQRLSSKPIEVFKVPGDHYTMIAPPHVERLAEYLATCLLAI